MKYRRIDKDTIQCIVTGEDMEEYGLTLGDIFERSQRAEDFFRELIEEARDTVGYECDNSGNIAMQITPMHDDGMIITITHENAASMKGFLEHMKDVMEAIAGGNMSLDDVHEHVPGLVEAKKSEPEIKHEISEQPKDIRVFEFASMDDVLSFASDGFAAGQVKSYFGKADDKYYLVLIKNRCSWKNFNKLSAKAFDFSTVIIDVSSKLVYLSEHGEGLIENGALSKLSKISRG